MGYSRQSFSNQSNLAKQLQPPSDPQPKRRFVRFPRASFGTILYRLLATVLSIVAALFALAGYFIFQSQYSPGHEMTNNGRLALPYEYWIALGISGGIALIVFVPVLIINFVPLRKRQRQREAIRRPSVEAAQWEYEQQMRRWQRARMRWSELLYCSRDGSVFLPGASSYAPVSSMYSYLYDDNL